MDHTQSTITNKERMDSLRTLYQDTEQYEETLKHQHADEKRRDLLTKKQQKAHESLEDVEKAQMRKELYDRLEESERHMKEHDLELKQEMVEANRHDNLQGIKERQAHLQGH